ncbi:chemotaxis protein CheW [Caldalkalibacillus salinus]|uniref:chemotaxis protein CheW n=1 Tax=Caldalkalibacillus salinus TaxID=2803787 RepID=UPI001923EBE3|nr:chemotaxis protein CheW [Caldalkalibacillus salinus]
MSEKGKKVIAFRLGKEEFALSLLQVLSIERVNEISRIPRLPEQVRGVSELRGEVTPVMDMRSFMDVPHYKDDEANRILVINFEGTKLGLLVDEAKDVLTVQPDDYEELELTDEEARIYEVAKVDDRKLFIIKDLTLFLTELDMDAIERLREVV